MTTFALRFAQAGAKGQLFLRVLPDNKTQQRQGRKVVHVDVNNHDTKWLCRPIRLWLQTLKRDGVEYEAGPQPIFFARAASSALKKPVVIWENGIVSSPSLRGACLSSASAKTEQNAWTHGSTGP